MTTVHALIEILRPFAALDIAHRDKEPDDRVVFALNDTLLTLGDIRRAKEVVGGYTIDAEWQALARAGDYIGAIRTAREVRGLSLYDAKELVDRSGMLVRKNSRR